MGFFKKIFSGIKKVVKAVAQVAVKALVNVALAPLKPLIDLAKNVFEAIKGANQQPPVQPMPPPNPEVFANAPSGSGVSLNGITIPGQMPKASDYGDLTNNNNKAAYDQAMLRFQEEQQAYNRAIDMLTKIMQMRHETLKGIIQNFRA